MVVYTSDESESDVSSVRGSSSSSSYSNKSSRSRKSSPRKKTRRGLDVDSDSDGGSYRRRRRQRRDEETTLSDTEEEEDDTDTEHESSSRRWRRDKSDTLSLRTADLLKKLWRHFREGEGGGLDDLQKRLERKDESLTGRVPRRDFEAILSRSTRTMRPSGPLRAGDIADIIDEVCGGSKRGKEVDYGRFLDALRKTGRKEKQKKRNGHLDDEEAPTFDEFELDARVSVIFKYV